MSPVSWADRCGSNEECSAPAPHRIDQADCIAGQEIVSPEHAFDDVTPLEEILSIHAGEATRFERRRVPDTVEVHHDI